MAKTFTRKLVLNKKTVSNLGTEEKNNVKGGAPVTYNCSNYCSEPDLCDTWEACGCTVGLPYLCPSIAPYPGC